MLILCLNSTSHLHQYLQSLIHNPIINLFFISITSFTSSSRDLCFTNNNPSFLMTLISFSVTKAGSKEDKMMEIILLVFQWILTVIIILQLSTKSRKGPQIAATSMSRKS